MSLPPVDYAGFLYLNPDVCEANGVYTVDAAKRFLEVGASGGGSRSVMPSGSNGLPPAHFDAHAYLAAAGVAADVSAMNRFVARQEILEGLGASEQRNNERFVSNILARINRDQVSPTVAPLPGAFVAEQLSGSSVPVFGPNAVQAGDRVLLVINDADRFETEVASVDPATNRIVFVEDPVAPDTSFENMVTVDPQLSSLVPPTRYRLIGILVTDAVRIAAINISRGVRGRLLPDPDFNPELYRLLYPDARLMDSDAAYEDYAGRAVTSNYRIGKEDDLLANKDGFIWPHYETERLLVHGTAEFRGPAVFRDTVHMRDVHLDSLDITGDLTVSGKITTRGLAAESLSASDATMCNAAVRRLDADLLAAGALSARYASMCNAAMCNATMGDAAMCNATMGDATMCNAAAARLAADYLFARDATMCNASMCNAVAARLAADGLSARDASMCNATMCNAAAARLAADYLFARDATMCNAAMGDATMCNAFAESLSARYAAMGNATMCNATMCNAAAARLAADSFSACNAALFIATMDSAAARNLTADVADIAALRADSATVVSVAASNMWAAVASMGSAAVLGGLSALTADLASAVIGRAAVSNAVMGSASITTAVIEDARVVSLTACNVAAGSLLASDITTVMLSACNVATVMLTAAAADLTSASIGTASIVTATLGSLRVDGPMVAASDATFLGVVTAESNMVVRGDLVVYGSLGTSGDIALSGDLELDGDLTLSGSLALSGDLALTGAATFGSNIDVRGAATFGSNIDVRGAASFNSNMDVRGAATFGSNMSVAGAATFGSNMSVAGAASFGSNIDVRGAASFGSNIDVRGAVSMGSNLDVRGAASFGSNMSVAGAASFGSNMSVAGAARFHDIDVSGTATFCNLVDMRGAVLLRPWTASNASAPQQPGQIRYNADIERFQGFIGVTSSNGHWDNLGSPLIVPTTGVIDGDGGTRVTAELSPGFNDDVVRVYADEHLVASFSASNTVLYGQDGEALLTVTATPGATCPVRAPRLCADTVSVRENLEVGDIPDVEAAISNIVYLLSDTEDPYVDLFEVSPEPASSNIRVAIRVEEKTDYTVYIFATSNIAGSNATAFAASPASTWRALWAAQRRLGQDGAFVAFHSPHAAADSSHLLTRHYPTPAAPVPSAPLLSFTYYDVYAFVEDSMGHLTNVYRVGTEQTDAAIPGSCVLRHRVRTLDFVAPRADLHALSVSSTALDHRELRVGVSNVRDDFYDSNVFDPGDLSSYYPGYRNWQFGVFAVLEPVDRAVEGLVTTNRRYNDTASNYDEVWAVLERQAALPSAAAGRLPIHSGSNVSADGALSIAANNFDVTVGWHWAPSGQTFRRVTNYARYRAYAALRDVPVDGATHSNVRLQWLEPARVADRRAPQPGSLAAPVPLHALRNRHELRLESAGIYDHTQVTAHFVTALTADAAFATMTVDGLHAFVVARQTQPASAPVPRVVATPTGATAVFASHDDPAVTEDEPQLEFSYAVSLFDRYLPDGSAAPLLDYVQYTVYVLLEDAFGNRTRVAHAPRYTLDVTPPSADGVAAVRQTRRGVASEAQVDGLTLRDTYHSYDAYFFLFETPDVPPPLTVNSRIVAGLYSAALSPVPNCAHAAFERPGSLAEGEPSATAAALSMTLGFSVGTGPSSAGSRLANDARYYPFLFIKDRETRFELGVAAGGTDGNWRAYAPGDFEYRGDADAVLSTAFFKYDALYPVIRPLAGYSVRENPATAAVPQPTATVRFADATAFDPDKPLQKPNHRFWVYYHLLDAGAGTTDAPLGSGTALSPPLTGPYALTSDRVLAGDFGDTAGRLMGVYLATERRVLEPRDITRLGTDFTADVGYEVTVDVVENRGYRFYLLAIDYFDNRVWSYRDIVIEPRPPVIASFEVTIERPVLTGTAYPDVLGFDNTDVNRCRVSFVAADTGRPGLAAAYLWYATEAAALLLLQGEQDGPTADYVAQNYRYVWTLQTDLATHTSFMVTDLAVVGNEPGMLINNKLAEKTPYRFYLALEDATGNRARVAAPVLRTTYDETKPEVSSFAATLHPDNTVTLDYAVRDNALGPDELDVDKGGAGLVKLYVAYRVNGVDDALIHNRLWVREQALAQSSSLSWTQGGYVIDLASADATNTSSGAITTPALRQWTVFNFCAAAEDADGNLSYVNVARIGNRAAAENTFDLSPPRVAAFFGALAVTNGATLSYVTTDAVLEAAGVAAGTTPASGVARVVMHYTTRDIDVLAGSAFDLAADILSNDGAAKSNADAVSGTAAYNTATSTWVVPPGVLAETTLYRLYAQATDAEGLRSVTAAALFPGHGNLTYDLTRPTVVSFSAALRPQPFGNEVLVSFGVADAGGALVDRVYLLATTDAAAYAALEADALKTRIAADARHVWDRPGAAKVATLDVAGFGINGPASADSSGAVGSYLTQYAAARYYLMVRDGDGNLTVAGPVAHLDNGGRTWDLIVPTVNITSAALQPKNFADRNRALVGLSAADAGNSLVETVYLYYSDVDLVINGASASLAPVSPSLLPLGVWTVRAATFNITSYSVALSRTVSSAAEMTARARFWLYAYAVDGQGNAGAWSQAPLAGRTDPAGASPYHTNWSWDFTYPALGAVTAALTARGDGSSALGSRAQVRLAATDAGGAGMGAVTLAADRAFTVISAVSAGDNPYGGWDVYLTEQYQTYAFTVTAADRDGNATASTISLTGNTGNAASTGRSYDYDNPTVALSAVDVTYTYSTGVAAAALTHTTFDNRSWLSASLAIERPPGTPLASGIALSATGAGGAAGNYSALFDGRRYLFRAVATDNQGNTAAATRSPPAAAITDVSNEMAASKYTGGALVSYTSEAATTSLVLYVLDASDAVKRTYALASASGTQTVAKEEAQSASFASTTAYTMRLAAAGADGTTVCRRAHTTPDTEPPVYSATALVTAVTETVNGKTVRLDYNTAAISDASSVNTTFYLVEGSGSASLSNTFVPSVASGPGSSGSGSLNLGVKQLTTYTVVARAVDASLNMNAAEKVWGAITTLSSDTTPPAVSGVTLVRSGANAVLTFSVADNAGGVGLSEVRAVAWSASASRTQANLYNDAFATVQKTVWASPGTMSAANISYTFPAAQDAALSAADFVYVSIGARDHNWSIGGSGTTFVTTFVGGADLRLDMRPPAVSISVVAAIDIDAQVTFAAADAGTGVAATTLRVTRGATVEERAVSAPQTAVWLSALGFSQATFAAGAAVALLLTSTDNNGNAAAASASTTLGPTSAGATYANSGVTFAHNPAAANSTFTVGFTANASYSSAQGYSAHWIRILQGTGSASQATVTGAGSPASAAGQPPSGTQVIATDGAGAAFVENRTYTLYLAVQDNAYPAYGGTFGSRKVTTFSAAAYAPLAYTLPYFDVTPPDITNIAGSQSVNDGSVTFTFNVRDPVSGLAAVYYGVTASSTADAQALNDRSAAPGNTTAQQAYSGNWTGLANYSIYYLKIKAVDARGNTGSASYTFRTHDRVNPTIDTFAVTQPTYNTLQARYKASDAATGLRSVSLAWNPAVAGSSSTDGAGVTTYTTVALAVGTYTATFTATDAANQAVGAGGYLSARADNAVTNTSAAFTVSAPTLSFPSVSGSYGSATATYTVTNNTGLGISVVYDLVRTSDLNVIATGAASVTSGTLTGNLSFGSTYYDSVRVRGVITLTGNAALAPVYSAAVTVLALVSGSLTASVGTFVDAGVTYCKVNNTINFTMSGATLNSSIQVFAYVASSDPGASPIVSGVATTIYSNTSGTLSLGNEYQNTNAYVYAKVTFANATSSTIRMSGLYVSLTQPLGTRLNPRSLPSGDADDDQGLPACLKGLYVTLLGTASDGLGALAKGRFFTLSGGKALVRPGYLPGWNQWQLVVSVDPPYDMFHGSRVMPTGHNAGSWAARYLAISLNAYVTNLRSNSSYRYYLDGGHHMSSDMYFEKDSILVGGYIPGGSVLQMGGCTDYNLVIGTANLAWGTSGTDSNLVIWPGHYTQYVNIEVDWT